MKTIVLILILAAFLQTTTVPVNLVLVILICRAYIKQERTNLFLAFAFGLLVGHLSLGNPGLQSLIFLILVELAQIFSNTRFSTRSLLVIPLSFILLLADLWVNSLLNHQSLQVSPGNLVGSLLSFPIFYLIKLWEERFIVQKDIKLKL